MSNCVNVLILPGYRLHINMSNAGPITNRYLTGRGSKEGYDGIFTISLHLITFLLTSNIWFLIIEGYLPQPASRIHLVMCIMNTLNFGELVGILYWIFQKRHVVPMKGLNTCTPLVRCFYLSSSLGLEFQGIPSTYSIPHINTAPYPGYLRSNPRDNTSDMDATLFGSNRSWRRTLPASPRIYRIMKYRVLNIPRTLGAPLICQGLCGTVKDFIFPTRRSSDLWPVAGRP